MKNEAMINNIKNNSIVPKHYKDIEKIIENFYIEYIKT